MDITGIICEYNPLHLGHKKQFDCIRRQYPDTYIVCLMSGNFVQRGKPAIVDKSIRAEAAVRCGADLVLELPVIAALSSAEGFAAEGVRILGSFCNRLCFGAETGSTESLLSTARTLLSEDFSAALRTHLDRGLSFPAAREKAMEDLGAEPEILSRPNDILAVEYCKAIVQQQLSMEIMPILREGSYHDLQADPENPSATALRRLLLEKGNWQDYVPAVTVPLLENAKLHALSAGEKAILYRLQTMTDDEYQALPYGSEGLWRKLMRNARALSSLEEILTATKSKRYTRTRLDRMVLCAFLGITAEDLRSPAPYVRVLAFNQRGREILKEARLRGEFPNAGTRMDDPCQLLEERCGDLYGLFALDATEPPGAESRRRVCYIDE